jgi:hypothetical protein
MRPWNEGRITPHHRFLVGQHLRMIEELEAAVAAFDARIEAALVPFHDAAERLTSLPGITDVAAQVILAEIGPDMSPFPDGRPSAVVGWAYAAARRERRQAALDAAEERRAVAQTCARAVRLCSGAGREHLPAGPVSAPQSAPGAEEGRHRGDCIDPPRTIARAVMRLVRRIQDFGYDVEIKAAA